MLTIYGVNRSRASRVVWLCHELGLPFLHVPVIQAYRLADPHAADAPQNTLSPDFLAMSPQGLIPVIKDEGLVLTESLAITLHLARKHGTDVGPQDYDEDALMSQWSFYGTTAIEPDALTIQMLHGRTTLQSPDDADLVSQAVERLARPLKVVEDHLSTHAYMVGGRFTVADLNLAEIIRYASGHTELMEGLPSIRAWLAACHDRPAFKAMWAARLAEPE